MLMTTQREKETAAGTVSFDSDALDHALKNKNRKLIIVNSFYTTVALNEIDLDYSKSEDAQHLSSVKIMHQSTSR